MATEAGIDDLIVRRAGPAATVVINRPDQRNAITFDMWRRFPELFRGLDADPSVRVLLIAGEGGKAFSAGADIKDFQETRSTPEKALAYRDRVEEACETLQKLATPTLAVIRGYCIGGGFELAMHADIRVGDETARIGLPAAKRGLVVGHGFLSRLEHLVGAARTSYLMLSARLIDADEARQAGLLAAVLPPGELDAYVDDLVADIAEASPLSHRIHKSVIEDLIVYGSPEAVPPERLALPSRGGTSDDFGGRGPVVLGEAQAGLHRPVAALFPSLPRRAKGVERLVASSHCIPLLR
jgi:enoyl-CoA hydratase